MDHLPLPETPDAFQKEQFGPKWFSSCRNEKLLNIPGYQILHVVMKLLNRDNDFCRKKIENEPEGV